MTTCCCVAEGFQKAAQVQWLLAAGVAVIESNKDDGRLNCLVYGTPNMVALVSDEPGNGFNVQALHAFTGDLLGSQPKAV